VELLPPYNQPNALRGIEEFSHIWLLFVFDQNIREGWKATVRPPRLGGDRRIGVFASRSPFRPAPIGLSAVRLEGIIAGGHGKLALKVSGLDLADGTPVLDIKPYLPYADIIPGATGGFAPDAPEEQALKVRFAAAAEEKLRRCRPEFRELCRKVVSADPRPAYQRIPGRLYQCYLEEFEVLWQVEEKDPMSAVVTDLNYMRGKSAEEMKRGDTP